MALETTGFDSLHITPEVIRELLVGLHRSQRLSHHGLLDVGDRVLEVAVQVVQKCWIDPVKRSGEGRHPIVTHPLMCSVPLLFNLRSASVLADEGLSGWATVNLALIFEPPAHQGVVPPKFAHSVRLDFSPTQAADVLLPPDIPIAGPLKAAIRDFAVATFSGTYPLPEGELRNLSAQTPLEIIPVLGPQPQLVVRPLGKLRDATGRRLPTEIPEGARLGSPGEARWHMVVGPQRLRTMLRTALIQSLPQAVRERFEGGDVSEATFSDGALTSQLKKAGMEPISINVRADSVEGARPRWSIEAPSIGLRATRDLPTVPPAPSKGKPSPTTQEQVRLGGINFALASHQIRRTGFHMSGLVSQATEATPVVEFAWFRKPSSALTVIFYGFRSWCPGSSIQEVTWDFGDGGVQTLSGEKVRLVVTHTFADNGPYTVRLRITDDAGRQAVSEQRVTLGTLQVRASRPVVTAQGTMRSRIHVASGNTPLAGVKLLIESALGNVNILTDEYGFADIETLFSPFSGSLTRKSTARARVGAEASLTIISGGERSSFPISVMDSETYFAIIDTASVARRLANPTIEGGDPDAVRLLGRRARRLEAALVRGEMPSWGPPARGSNTRQRSSASDIRQMAERLEEAAARASSKARPNSDGTTSEGTPDAKRF